MILVIVWDGLRPDMVTPEQTPYLYATSQRGAFCQASHAAFPTATRINASTLATGCYPARHGIVDNELYIPAVDPTKATSCADWEALQRMAHAEGGPLLTAPTLGEVLRGAGRRLACVGSGSPGTTYLTNPGGHRPSGELGRGLAGGTARRPRRVVRRHAARDSTRSSGTPLCCAC